MSFIDAMKEAGFKPELSTAGGKMILKGTYKASFYDWAKMEDKGFGESIYAQFKITETLEGRDSNSKFPEFKGYFSLADDKVASKKSGLAKLINGFFSVGVSIDWSSEEALAESLNNAKGTEVFISAWSKQPMKKEGDEWVEDDTKEPRQDFTFLTEKNALKKVKKTPAPF